jgi:hypothetical protein
MTGGAAAMRGTGTVDVTAVGAGAETGAMMAVGTVPLPCGAVMGVAATAPPSS